MMIQRWELSATHGAAMSDCGKFMLYDDAVLLMAENRQLRKELAESVEDRATLRRLLVAECKANEDMP